MELHEALRPVPGSVRKPKRKGQGIGSGTGKTAGRGHKGQKARSGGAKGPGFEGGQTKLVRRLPKRGFRNIFGVEYSVVNLRDLAAKFPEGAEVGPQEMARAGLVDGNRPVKVLGDGVLEKPMVIKAHAFSAGAIEKIRNSGGKIEVI